MKSSTGWLGGLFVALLCHGTTLAQHSKADPPVTGRPLDFSNIVGVYQISASASPTDVSVEQPITLRVIVTGDGPERYQPRRDQLRILPEEWNHDFYIEELPEQHRIDLATKTWEFVYQLKPKRTGIEAIEGIKLIFYNPNLSEKKRFSTYMAERIPITVRPRTPSDGPEVDVLVAPESFYHVVSQDAVMTDFTEDGNVSFYSCLVYLVAAPLVCLLGLLGWKNWHPDELELHLRRRSGAATYALAQLQSASGPVWNVVYRYLQDRYNYTVQEPTPAEVKAFLLRRGVNRDMGERTQALLEACDALHYAQGPFASSNLHQRALEWIHAMEAPTCAS